MELKQVVKCSEKGSFLQAIAAPKVCKEPVTSEQRGRKMVDLPLGFEMWSGAETISVISIIAPVVCLDFYHLYCTHPTPGASLLSFPFILCSYFYSEGVPTRLLQSS